MDSDEIAGRRLVSQGLSGAPFRNATEVVGWLGAAQSQEYAVAKWSVGQRSSGLSDAAMDAALADGALVRTHVLRPTWHFVTVADVRWLLALTGPRVLAGSASYHRKYGLDEAAFAASNALLEHAVAGGAELTRKEIAGVLAGITTDSIAVGFLLMHAELTGVIGSGGLKGKQRTYASFAERVPPAPAMARDEALAELTRRYFTSHGPATRADFQWWSGLTAPDARRGLELAAHHLVQDEVDGRSFWSGAGPPPGRPDPSPTVHLLQGYDEYFVAYRNSRIAYDREGRLPAGAAGPFLHGIILDGRYVGNWRRTLTANRMTVEVQLMHRLGRAQRAALGEAVDRYAAFVGVPADLVLG